MTRLSIEELADAAGLTRRGIRFYVQQGLLPLPLGVGRGKHYDQSHLDRLQKVRDLQAAGHSLEEIRQILGGNPVSLAGDGSPEQTARLAPAPPNVAPTPAALRAELWRKLRLMEGVELSFDAARFNPTVEQLLALRDSINNVFRSPDTSGEDTQHER